MEWLTKQRCGEVQTASIRYRLRPASMFFEGLKVASVNYPQIHVTNRVL